jgi:hypothetical protein
VSDTPRLPIDQWSFSTGGQTPPAPNSYEAKLDARVAELLAIERKIDALNHQKAAIYIKGKAEGVLEGDMRALLGARRYCPTAPTQMVLGAPRE